MESARTVARTGQIFACHSNKVTRRCTQIRGPMTMKERMKERKS